MKDIKFRALGTRGEGWIYWTPKTEESTWSGEKTFWQLLESGYYENLCQFTGLSDKNGKEIYTGDILGCTEGDDFHKKYYGENISVIFNESKARFEVDRSVQESHRDLPENLRHGYTVIGNNIENEELLK